MFTKFKAIIGVIILAAVVNVTASAQDLTLTTLDGQSVNLAGQGKVAVLLFSGSQDPQCREGLKALGSLAERYRGKNVSIYWVSIDPSTVNSDQVRSACGNVQSVTLVRDPNRAAFKRFSGRVPQMPTVVVLNQQGQVQGQPRGGFNPNSDFVNDLAAVIDGIL